MSIENLRVGRYRTLRMCQEIDCKDLAPNLKIGRKNSESLKDRGNHETRLVVAEPRPFPIEAGTSAATEAELEPAVVHEVRDAIPQGFELLVGLGTGQPTVFDRRIDPVPLRVDEPVDEPVDGLVAIPRDLRQRLALIELRPKLRLSQPEVRGRVREVVHRAMLAPEPWAVLERSVVAARDAEERELA